MSRQSDASAGGESGPTTRDERFRRRSVLRAVGVGGVAALAGCKERPEEEAAVDRPESDDATDTETDVPDDLLAGETVKIGALGPLPEEHVLGKSIYHAAELAAERLNAENGILGAEVEVVPGDTQASPTAGKQEYIRLTREEDVDVTFGVFVGEVLMNIVPAMARQETLHVTTGSAIDEVGRLVSQQYDKYKYHFRAGPLNSTYLAAAQLEFLDLTLDSLGWDRAALLVENRGDFDPYYERLEAALPEYLDVPVMKRTSTSLSNWTPIFDEVENENVDVALVALTTTGVPAVKQWANSKRQFEFGGIHVWSQFTNFYEDTSGACEYVFTMNSATPQSSNTPRTQPFMDRFFERFGFYPVYAGPITRDAVMMYADAVRQVGSLATEDLIPVLEQQIYDTGTIVDTFEFTGPDAEFAHEPKWSSMKETGVPLWQQWQTRGEADGVEGAGSMQVFAPEQNKTADYQRPHWLE